MKLNLNTIILYVQDVKTLKAFYCGSLHLEVVEEDGDGWALLRAGGGYIGLHKAGNEYLEKMAAGYQFDNNAKIVFEMDGDIHAVRAELLARQVAMREIKTYDNYGYWLLDGVDPEGNVFQLKQKKANGA